MILSDSALIGVEVEYGAAAADIDSSWFRVLQCVWCSWYVAEVTLRILAARGAAFFFYSNERHWNRFDFALAILSVMGVILEFVLTSANVSSLRFVRSIRLARMFRIMRFFDELNLICQAIYSS